LYSAGQLLDSFKIFVETKSSPTVKLRDSHIKREFNINHNYQFFISNQNTITLANMKMIMRPKFSSFTEGYRCEMGDFTIDGVRYQKEDHPRFTKKEN
jgi:hypothetical protein